jgi:hypothetical protein
MIPDIPNMLCLSNTRQAKLIIHVCQGTEQIRNVANCPELQFGNSLPGSSLPSLEPYRSQTPRLDFTPSPQLRQYPDLRLVA